MKFNRDDIERLYETMSLTEIAEHLDVSRSTLYYQMKKLGCNFRSRSDAQKQYAESKGHQRSGKKHSTITKAQISKLTAEYWDSGDGQKHKERLAQLRKNEWGKSSHKKRQKTIERLNSAPRPLAGELSKFGQKLVNFLSQYEKIEVGIQLTPRHVSDIILEEYKVVIELLMPTDIYGDNQKNKIEARYQRITDSLNSFGYRVFLIEDKSNSVSLARCRRVYSNLLDFINDRSKTNIRVVT